METSIITLVFAPVFLVMGLGLIGAGIGYISLKYHNYKDMQFWEQESKIIQQNWIKEHQYQMTKTILINELMQEQIAQITIDQFIERFDFKYIVAEIPEKRLLPVFDTNDNDMMDTALASIWS